MHETIKIVQKCCDIDYDSLNADVIDRIKYLTLDYIGVASRGSLNSSNAPVHRYLKRMENGRGNDTTVIGTNLKTTPEYAALANGMSAHSLELDDVVNAASLHPGVVVMPAAFSAAHLAGCSGKKFIEGVVAGYEVTTRLGIALNPSAHYERGFHPTATCGTLGAAAASAKILDLGSEDMAHALGLAGSQAGGLMECLAQGSFSKRFHPGWAAHSGLLATLLAREGFAGPKSILEGKHGFLNAFSAKSDPKKLMKNWGKPYWAMQTSIKPHACCRYKQGPIDGILEIMKRENLKARDITDVTLGMLKTGIPFVVEPVSRKRKPETIVDAQFSMFFGAAVAILYGQATLDEYTQKNLQAPEILELMKYVNCIESEDLEKEFPVKWPASVTIRTKNNKEYFTKIDYPKGDPKNPLSWDEIIKKFRGLAYRVYTESKMDEIIQSIKQLNIKPDFTGLLSILSKNRSA